MFAIFKREFRSYFQNVIGWLFLAVVLVLYGIYFVVDNLIYGYAYLSYPLNSVTIILLIAVPILTMRSLSDERRNKTDQLTLTSPLSVGKLVLGKYLALVAIYTIEMVFIILSGVVLSFFGTVSFSESAVAILGFWLLGNTFIAVGLLISSLTESQVISAVLSFLVLFLLYMMSSICNLISSDGNIITAFLGIFAVSERYANFLSGLLDIPSIVYFVTVIALMLFLTCQSIQKRRWSVSRLSTSIGVFSVGYIVVAVVLVLVVNLLVNQIPATYSQIDCTYSKYYQITDDTKEVLAGLDQDVTIYCYVAESEKSSYYIDKTLDYYDAASKHVTVEYIDPNAYPTFMEQYSDETMNTASVAVVSDLRSRAIDFYALVEVGIDYSTYNYTYTYDVEGELTSAIQYVTMDEEDLPVIYEVTGHGETSMGSTFSEALAKANITLNELTLLNEEAVPDDAAAIIINSPTSDFNEADAQKVIDYLQAGGKALITGYYASQGLENFESILAAYDVSVVDGIVAENDMSSYYYQLGNYYIFPTIASTDYSSNAKSMTALLSVCEGFAYPDETDDDSTVSYTDILTTSDSAVSKVDYNNATTYAYEDGDVEGPFTVGLAVEDTVDDDNTMELVLIGSPVLMDDTYDSAVSNGNSTLFTDIISNFVGDVDLATSVIPSRSMYMDNLSIGTVTIYTFGAAIVVIVPIALLAAGIVVWAMRRKR